MSNRDQKPLTAAETDEIWDEITSTPIGGAPVHELDKAHRRLAEQVEKQRETIAELRRALTIALDGWTVNVFGLSSFMSGYPSHGTLFTIDELRRLTERP